MHSVTAATVAAGGGARAARCWGGWRPARRSARWRSASAAPARTSTRRSCGRSARTAVSGSRAARASSPRAATPTCIWCLCRARPRGRPTPTCFAGDRAGVRFDGTWSGLGMAGNSSVALEFDGRRARRRRPDRRAGEAVGLVFGAVAPFFLVGLAAVNVGIARGGRAAATEHARDRRYPDGSSLAEVQYVQHLLADMDIGDAAGAAARAGGGAAGRRGRRGGARRDHGGEGRCHRGGGRGDADARSR